MRHPNDIKVHHLNATMAMAALKEVEREHGITLAPQVDAVDDTTDAYYQQIEAATRREASAMAEHYEMFYCLETTIRKLIVEKLQAEVGAEWWSKAVPESVRANAEKNRQREFEAAVTARSDRLIDYTTFGELGEIVRQNWTKFSDVFNSQKGFDRVMTSLNLLRSPIAHCCPLASDEIDRLRLTVRDWFRLME
jgi:hypothetical protein